MICSRCVIGKFTIINASCLCLYVDYPGQFSFLFYSCASTTNVFVAHLFLDNAFRALEESNLRAVFNLQAVYSFHPPFILKYRLVPLLIE